MLTRKRTDLAECANASETSSGRRGNDPAQAITMGRRKHRHWKVTVYYCDGGKFARVYIDEKRAEAFAKRQERSPVIRSVRIRETNPPISAKPPTGNRNDSLQSGQAELFRVGNL
jgi:hypothetical protein